ncbi:uncharacterized protein LOC111093311 [Canis lupus familiaris]|uniref:uncharacterized protein LOC111093311 n=1 Tax=Canis lupus familiaris TaxID=9615 RepID=UPI000BAA0D5F|nr:uncharacterized protein LOC111093311 [Canis lupus familiaris]XP_038387350.1 uncharacterized protein LOC111093311 [Canis lupus familiaris]XP_038515654.1 uncharacterized protein LOC111093311 [Canis lupus familiaris]|eukprot:XP_022268435.1 uncharacterized protein LOC111093311 isoform X1 [Canis lupus familiaris]
MTSKAHPGLPGNEQAGTDGSLSPKEGLCPNSTSRGERANQSCHPARQLLSPIAGLQHLQRNLLWAQCWTHKEMPSKSLLKNHHHLNKCSPCPRHYAKSFTNIMPFVADNRQDVNFTEERTETHRCICQRSHTWYHESSRSLESRLLVLWTDPCQKTSRCCWPRTTLGESWHREGSVSGPQGVTRIRLRSWPLETEAGSGKVAVSFTVNFKGVQAGPDMGRTLLAVSLF